MSTAPVPTDHLAGREGKTRVLLSRLHDEELDEQIEYFRAMRGATSGRESYHWTTQLSQAIYEKSQRPQTSGE